MAAEKNWEIQQIDAVAAFLNGDIKEDVYVEMPMGWQQKGKINKAEEDAIQPENVTSCILWPADLSSVEH
ncbi:hypothetical protein GJ744_010693 [Endocarpon pusillum]|uniref:Reverse transcriptase Ty1/copia-type domain-containing protein n=1 Tax=Endocarpon pusillum TaxID=364733 RepID=A0A8H7AHT4_9EURO|nr:hypothetical protein GJ744_010693 [Endocarpon pusillum]